MEELAKVIKTRLNTGCVHPYDVHDNIEMVDTLIAKVQEEAKLKLAAQEESIRAVLEAIYNGGHDDHCLFCGRKDGIILRAAEQWGIVLELYNEKDFG